MVHMLLWVNKPHIIMLARYNGYSRAECEWWWRELFNHAQAHGRVYIHQNGDVDLNGCYVVVSVWEPAHA